MLLKLLSSNAELRNGYVVSLTKEGEVGRAIRELGVSVYSLDMSSAFEAPRIIARLTKILRAERTTLVSTWMYHADLIGGLAARLAGLPVIWGIRNSDLSSRNSSRLTRAVVRLLGLLSAVIPKQIISCSTRAVDIHVALGYRRNLFAVVPNGFQIEKFRPSDASRAAIRAELAVPPDAFLVGSVARFDPQKNLLGLLEVAARVRQKLPTAHFVLVGAGVTRSNVEIAGAVSALALSEGLHLLGKRTDVERIVAALDVFVLPSIYGEGFPNVLGEAMACGVPCITTDVGDSSFVVGPAGFVVPPGDHAALTDAILRLLGLTAQERADIGARGRQRVVENFEIGAVARKYQAIFESMSER